MSIDRNQPCPCGSGRKYKKCCLPKQQVTAAPVEAGWLRMRRTEGELVERIMALFHRDYGRVAFDLGWDEYTLWTDEAPDAEEWPELEAAFVAWLLFNWEPGRHAARRRRRPDGRVTTATGDALPAVTPARHLMARRGGDLDSYERRWLEEACTQPYTFCQVVAVEPGLRLDLRDLLLKRDVTVQERQASKTLSAGNVIYTKIVSLDGESVMLGCAPIVLPGNRVGMILEARDLILRRRGKPIDLVRRHDVELRDLYLALRREQMDPAPPALTNTDGDPLQMTRLDYELRCTVQQALDALLPLTGEDDAGVFADTFERDEAGALVFASIPWLRPTRPGGSMQNTVLANLDLSEGRLSVQVNSQQRADAAREQIAVRLGDRARFKGAVIESMEQLQATARANARSPEAVKRQQEQEALERSPEARALMEKLARQHWAAWPDKSLPALRGDTPRQAARTPAGRERLEALLLEFAGRIEQTGVPGPDLDALRRDLGLDRELPASSAPALTIADLRHFLPKPGRSTGATLPRVARHLQSIVEVASSVASATPVPTPIPCRRRPGRKPCPGELLAHQDAARGDIHWTCPVCGDVGEIHNWQGTAHDFGDRPNLPPIARISLVTGFQRRPGDEAQLAEIVFAGPNVTRELRCAVLDNRITELEGEYGDARAGSPVQVDRLEIEHESGTTHITILNRAIMLLHGNDEVMRRLHRVCVAVEKGKGGRS
ncbi:MAG: SEC-C domain-containing protein [bacterium]|nr:SEC-C domain-containing protein [bacterium]